MNKKEELFCEYMDLVYRKELENPKMKLYGWIINAMDRVRLSKECIKLYNSISVQDLKEMIEEAKKGE